MARKPVVAPDQAAGQTERVERAIADFARGAFVIVFDDESRENEGDLMVAAEHADQKALAHLLDHTAGVVCAALPFDRCAELDLPQMVLANSGLHETAFTVSVDLRPGATTGIPAAERARTIQALADPATRPEDLARPGHVFPIRAARGGVPGARWPYRGGGGPLPAGWPPGRDRDLRDRHGRLVHGPVPGSGGTGGR